MRQQGAAAQQLSGTCARPRAWADDVLLLRRSALGHYAMRDYAMLDGPAGLVALQADGQQAAAGQQDSRAAGQQHSGTAGESSTAGAQGIMCSPH